MIPIAKPILGAEEMRAVEEVIASGNLAQGGKVHELETEFAEYIGVGHAVAVNSGTAALHIALLSCGIKSGDEVITTPFSFISTANSIIHAGARPVFVDIEEDTFNIDPDAISERITSRTKAVMPVHLYGHPADMKPVMEVAEEYGLAVIEDACQAHGALYDGRKVGSFGAGAFSFYPTKNMTTGEGGMITTDDGEVAELARMTRSHGSKQRYVHEICGYNMRMTDIGAAIGMVQLGNLDEWNGRRIENAKTLNAGLKDLRGLITPVTRNGCKHVFHQYTIRITGEAKTGRDKVAELLGSNGIGTSIYYPIPIHKQPYYMDMGYDDTLPAAEQASSEVLSIPVHPSVEKHDLEYMIGIIRGVIE